MKRGDVEEVVVVVEARELKVILEDSSTLCHEYLLQVVETA